MDWSSVQYNPGDEFHRRLVRQLPAPFDRLLWPGVKLGFWAHAHGHGCDA